MATRLSLLAQKFAKDAAAFRRETLTPVLVWEAAPGEKPKGITLGTVSSYRHEPRAPDPLVFTVLKRLKKMEAFPLGVTLGRMPSNDILVDEPSVSRFHCFFQQDPHTGFWHVSDAESFNGTFCDGVRLPPSRPAPLRDRVDLRIGFIEMRFLSPVGLEGYLTERARNPPRT